MSADKSGSEDDEKTSGAAEPADAAEGGGDDGATQANVKRVTTAKKTRATAARTPAAPKKDMVKIIALGACAVMALAIVVVVALRWDTIKKNVFGDGKPKPETAKAALPPDVDKMIKAFDQAEANFAQAEELAKKNTIEDLRKAQELVQKATDAWAQVRDFGMTFPGFEEKRNLSENRIGTAAKRRNEIGQRLFDLENAARIEARKNESNKPAPEAHAATTKSGEITEEQLKKIEQNDPSEYEEIQNQIKAGKLKLIK